MALRPKTGLRRGLPSRTLLRHHGRLYGRLSRAGPVGTIAVTLVVGSLEGSLLGDGSLVIKTYRSSNGLGQSKQAVWNCRYFRRYPRRGLIVGSPERRSSDRERASDGSPIAARLHERVYGESPISK